MMAVETFNATTTHPGKGMQVEVTTRGHKIIIDEPKSLGGTDNGMNPVEAILGALGACQSIVAQVYAKQFDVTYDELRIELEGDLDLDGFLNKSDVRPGFSDIRYKFYLKTDEPAEKIQPFIDFIEQKCPVGDTIANTVRLAFTGFEIVKRAPIK